MGRNDDQLVPLVGLAKDSRLSVRFIEVMPIGLGKDLSYRSEAEVRAILEDAYGPMLPYDAKLGNGPCHYFSLPGFTGKVGFISALSHQFCDQCNRVRLTSEGFLKTCLQYEMGVDLKALMEDGCGDDSIAQAVSQAIYDKPHQHHFADTSGEVFLEQHVMSQIGG
jgi:cyclic pyranopterin phosphate synthase